MSKKYHFICSLLLNYTTLKKKNVNHFMSSVNKESDVFILSTCRVGAVQPQILELPNIGAKECLQGDNVAYIFSSCNTSTTL